MFVSSTLYARVEKLRRVDWARIVGGAKSCAPAMISAPSAWRVSLSPGHRVLDRAQAHDGIRDADRQRRDQLRQAVAEVAVLLADACRDGNAGAQLDALGLQAARVHPLADRAGGDREDDVVDRAAEDVLDALEVLQLACARTPRAGAGRSRRSAATAGPGAAPSSRSPPTPWTARRRRRRSPSAPAARSGSSPRSRSVPLTDIAASSAWLGSGCATQLREPRARRGRRRRDVEQRGGDVHAADPVDDAVVGLRQDREAVVGEALDQQQLPERLGAVQPLGVDPRDEPAQRRLVARGSGAPCAARGTRG